MTFKAANICNNGLFLFIRSPTQPTAAGSVRCIHSLPAKQKVSIIHHSTASVCKCSPAGTWRSCKLRCGEIFLRPPPSSVRFYISATCCICESLYRTDLDTTLHCSKCSSPHLSSSYFPLYWPILLQCIPTSTFFFFFFLWMICDAHCFISSMEAKWQCWLGPPLQILSFFFFFKTS